MKEFIHLHNHTEYSLLDGYARLTNLIDEAVKSGARAIAITDHGNMYGCYKFKNYCEKNKIKPIIGSEFYFTEDASIKNMSTRRYHLVLIAKNLVGYQNLLKLSSYSFVDGFYSKPRIDWNVLEKYSEGLICLSGCLAGYLSQILLQVGNPNKYEEAKNIALRFKSLFQEDFYIELQNHEIEDELRVLPLLRKIANEIGVKTVATNDIHYVKKSDADAHDVLLALQTNSAYDDPNRMRFYNDSFYYKSYDEMLEAIGDEESLATTIEIADKVEYLKFDTGYKIPVVNLPEGYASDNDYLRDLTYKGLKMRYGEITEEISTRADYELGIISSKGFSSYYLMVWDFIEYSKVEGIPVGPGRGSGVGSIVAYAIKITDVEPLQYGLLFERFLNSSRSNMPDFDIDFCSDRREETIAYVRNKYTESRVTQIITFGKMKKKNAIKGVARVFQIPFADVNKLVKDIPDIGDIATKAKLSDLINPDSIYALDSLIEYYKNPEYKKVIDYAIALEGLPKDRGKHAAGVIICSQDIDTVVPLSRNGEDITTQYDKDECEAVGLVKMDFLALKTLTDIDKAKALVAKRNIKIDFNELGYEDQNVYEMIGNGLSDTVFQLESGGMKNFMRQLRPNLLEEIIAGVSLYRPGPMDYIPTYVHNKQNKDKINYRNSLLEPILKTTYGVIVYQEQAMMITQALAGFTMNEADNFRKVISKKKAEYMAPIKASFLEGCKKNGLNENFSITIWDELEKFGSYAFNKSHAAAYSVLSYQTAYLKYYYPVEFLCAVMNNRIGNPDDTSKYLKLTKTMNIQILPPDINHSEGLFIPTKDGAIRYGLVCIKNAGKLAIDAIVNNRNRNGEFVDFEDFIERTISEKTINKRMLESLIKGGAFDCFPQNRATLLANYERIMNSKQKSDSIINSDQMFFDFLVPEKHKYIVVKESQKKRLIEEKEVLGRYISGHPLDNYGEEFATFKFDTSMLLPVENEELVATEHEEEVDTDIVNYQVNHGDMVYFGGMLSDITVKFSAKTGKNWAYGTIEDMKGSAEIVFYPRVLERYKTLIDNDKLVKVQGKIVLEDGRPPKIDCAKVFDWYIEEVDKSDNKRLYLNITNEEVLNRLIAIAEKYSGGNGSVIVIKNHKKYKLQQEVHSIEKMKEECINILGFKNVIVKDK